MHKRTILSSLIGTLLLTSQMALAFNPCDSSVKPDDRTSFGFHLSYEANNIVPMSSEDFSKARKKKSSKVYRHILDTAFEQYICRDSEGNIAGYDVELISRAVMDIDKGFTHIEFVIEPWTEADVAGKKSISLFKRLIEELGLAHSASAGMSITADRIELVDMVGGTYKAGKRLIGWAQNPRLENKTEALLKLPEGDFQVLKGLVTLEEKSTIRGKFWKLLALSEKSEGRDYIEIIELTEEEAKTFKPQRKTDKLTVILVDGRMQIDEITKGRFDEASGNPMGVDFLMIDTGTVQKLKDDGSLDEKAGEGKNGRDVLDLAGEISHTQLPEVKQNEDGSIEKTGEPIGDAAFGLGDGVAFLPEDLLRLIDRVETHLKSSGVAEEEIERKLRELLDNVDRSIPEAVAVSLRKFKRSGLLDAIIEKYFHDKTASKEIIVQKPKISCEDAVKAQ